MWADFASHANSQLKVKSEAHEALLCLFQWVGVQPAKICDNAKEMIHSAFNRKLKEVVCHLKQTEPFTSWLNAAERNVKEFEERFS